MTTIEDGNLSKAWGKALLTLKNTKGHFLRPLVVTVLCGADGTIHEDPEIRESLDGALQSHGNEKGKTVESVRTVANTIFPKSLWMLTKDRQAFYAEYLRNLPRLVAWEKKKNRNGLYFARMIGFGVDPKTGEQEIRGAAKYFSEDGNQLEYIIQRCKRGLRHSMFQIAIYDPWRDLRPEPRMGFPCLQHVTFSPDFHAGTLGMNAFYATQQFVLKAYGNYLGLAELGAFVAEAAGLKLSRLTCFIGEAKMDQGPTSSSTIMKHLVSRVTESVGSHKARLHE